MVNGVFLPATQFRDHLLSNQTPQEKLFADRLIKLNIPFVRQKLLGPWIADFYIPSHRIIFEIDGDHHNTYMQMKKDARKTAYADIQYIDVVRIHNKDVSTYNLTEFCVTTPDRKINAAARSQLTNDVIKYINALPDDMFDRINKSMGLAWVPETIDDVQTYIKNRYGNVEMYSLSDIPVHIIKRRQANVM